MGLVASCNDHSWEACDCTVVVCCQQWPFRPMGWIRSLSLAEWTLLNLWFLGYCFSRAVVLQSYSLSVDVSLLLFDNIMLANLLILNASGSSYKFHPLVLMMNLTHPQLLCHALGAFYVSFLLLTSSYLPHLMGRHYYSILWRRKLGFRQVYQLGWGYRASR